MNLRLMPRRAQTLRAQLQVQRAVVQDELAQLTQRLRLPDYRDAQDDGERASQDMQRTFDAGRVQALAHALRDIEAALSQHAEGRYGRCTLCGGNIPVLRLRSLPTVRFCRVCQEWRGQAADRLAA